MTDARLLVPAAAAWLGAGASGALVAAAPSIAARHETAGRLGVALGVAGVVLGVAVALLVLPRRGVRRGAGPWVRTAIIAVAALLCGSAAAVAAALPRSAEPLSGWVDARATASVVGTVVGEPVVRRSQGPRVWRDAAWVEARLAATGIRARGTSIAVGVPVVVRLPLGPAPVAGATIEVAGRLGRPPPSTDAAALLVVRGDPPAWRLMAAPGVAETAAQAMRSALRAALLDTAPDPRSLVAGLAIGDDSAQPEELTVAMRASGLAHLTAVSGGNVAIVLGVVLALFAAIRAPVALRVTGSGAALAFFVLLVGPQPSVLRAAAMGAVIVIGLLVGGRGSGPAPLGAAVLALVLLQPWLALSWGFALSVVATAGLILLAPVIRTRLRRWPALARWPPALLAALSLTLAAQAVTAPVLLLMGGTVGWGAVPANLAAMPAVPVVTILGLAAATIGPIAPGAAGLLAEAAAWPAGWIASVARACAVLPAPTLSTPLLVGASVVLALLVLLRLRRRPSPLVVQGALAAALVVVVLLAALPPARRGWPPPGWLLIMCDVGQGDAILVRTGSGSALVVDSGPDPDRVDACLTDADIDRVDAVVLTHFHADHVRGLAGVLRDRSVAAVLTTPVREPSEEAARVDVVLATHGLVPESVTTGDSRMAGSAAWRVLWPTRLIAAGSRPNNASLVLAVEVVGRSLLLGGDIEPEAQVAVSPDLRARRFDVVKVPHHGSRYQAPGLVAWAPAPIALISAGAGNDYGHPAPETVASWSAIGAIVGRTDEHGDLAVVESGTGLGLVARGGMLPSS